MRDGVAVTKAPYGYCRRVVAMTALFETTTLIGEVRLLQERTVYARIGDLTAQLAVLIMLLALGVALWRPRVARA